MTLHITGSSGFVGTNFKNENLDYTIQDVDLLKTKPDQIDFTGCDALLHLAALVHQMKGAPDKEYFKVNSDLAFETAKYAKENGVKHFLFMSTVKVYGEFTYDTPWNEDTLCTPLDPYGKSKLEGEQCVKELEDENFTVSIIRTPLVYGAGVRANMFNLMRLVDKYSFIPFGNINNQRSLSYVGNLVQLIDEIIKQRKSGIFLSLDGEPISTSDLVKEIANNFVSKKHIVNIPMWSQRILKGIKPNIHQRLFGNLVVDNSKTIETLGYKPKYTFADGISQMVEWYKANK